MHGCSEKRKRGQSGEPKNNRSFQAVSAARVIPHTLLHNTFSPRIYLVRTFAKSLYPAATDTILDLTAFHATTMGG